MAIDTAAKRNSAILDTGNMPWPPDGSLSDPPDRLVMLEFYSGISSSSTPGQVPGLCFTLDNNRPEFTLRKSQGS